MLDSDVIFSRVLHGLFGLLAVDVRMFTLVWSEELLAEAERVLNERKPMPAAAARRWVSYMRDAFPNERIDIAGVDLGVDLASVTSDPADQHVCVLAIAGHADLLVSHDRGYLRDALLRHGIEVTNPDAVLLGALDQEPDAVLRVVELQAASWGGGRSVGELLDAIERAGATTFAAEARTAFAG